MRPTKQRTYLEHLKKDEVKIDLLLPCLNEVISQQLPSGKLFINCHPHLVGFKEFQAWAEARNNVFPPQNIIFKEGTERHRDIYDTAFRKNESNNR